MDHYSVSILNCFSTCGIDRVHNRRRDSRWIESRLESSTTRFVPLWELKNLFADGGTPSPVTLSFRELEDSIPDALSITFLGEEDRSAYFAIDLPANGSSPPERFAPFGQFRDLKSMGALIDCREGSLLAYARAIAYWHRRHRFCGDCGSPTESHEGGHMRVCSNGQCRQQIFPRTDPAIIVLITFEDRCLLGRQPIWPERFYSTIAGFVEPGESVEAAVIREAFEETGLQIQEVHYHSSQPWPFPSSLMLGFTARAASTQIRLEDDELEDARWFTRREVRDAVMSGALRLPSSISIAYRLIEDWIDAADSEQPLKEIVDATAR